MVVCEFLKVYSVIGLLFYSLQSAVCGLQSAVGSLQSAVCSLQSAVCGLQSAVCSLQSVQSANVIHRIHIGDPSMIEVEDKTEFEKPSDIGDLFWACGLTLSLAVIKIC